MLKKSGGTTLYEQVMDQIKEMIVSGAYKKGDLLPSEKELMQMTGVSRITVREALKSLTEVGMIETRRGKGSFVLVDADALSPDVPTAELQSEYRERFLCSNHARLALEPELARLAAKNASPEDIARMEALLRRRRASAAGENAFDGFHHAIAQAAGNPLLLEFMERLLKMGAVSQPVFHLTLPEQQKGVSSILSDHHKKIFQAIRDGSEEFAYFYMREHLLFLLRSYEEYFARFC